LSGSTARENGFNSREEARSKQIRRTGAGRVQKDAPGPGIEGEMQQVLDGVPGRNDSLEQEILYSERQPGFRWFKRKGCQKESAHFAETLSRRRFKSVDAAWSCQ